MKKLDWNRYLPLGLDGRKTKNRLLAALGVAAGWSLGFVLRYSGARADLFVYQNGRRYLTIGAKIKPFEELVGDAFWLLYASAAAAVLLILGFYALHYQECRSIYTMKRLPNRWELWRRCLTLPVCFAAACGLTVLVLFGLYNLIYLLCTPAGCLP